VLSDLEGGVATHTMLLDREREKRELDRLLALVREGLSGALVLRGEAGIGKSVLLEYAVESAGDMRVAHVVGVESEMEMGFAGLHQLLVPFLPELERLPAPQSEALSSAFGLIAGAGADLFLVGLAALTLLADAAGERPVLCVVDDAQWLDHASAGALGFVARRLFADRIAMLFAVRDPSERLTTFDGLSELRVEGLPDDEARELLASVASGRLDQQTGERIVSQTRGNPLALLELGGELTAGQLAGSSPLPEPLPLGKRLEERFLSRVRTLPAHTQTLLLLVSAEQSGDLGQLWRAAGILGIGREAANLPELDRLITLEPRLAFRHPLMRSAVYHGASAYERRQAHEALAAVSDPDGDADRRAWHLAAASLGADEQVAAELESSADRARDRGGWAAAAACLSRAADLTPDEHLGAVRRLRAAEAELSAGAPAVAAAMLERATPRLVDARDRAEARRLEARVRFATGECASIPGLLLDAARALRPLAFDDARETLLEAFDAVLFAGRDAGEAGFSAIASLVRETPRPARETESVADLLLDGIALLEADYPSGVPVLSEALQALKQGAAAKVLSPRFTTVSYRVAEELWDDEALEALVSGYLRLARERGDLTAMLAALTLKVNTETLAGRFVAAEAALGEARQLSAATGNVGGFLAADADPLNLLVWRGEEARARLAATALSRRVAQRGAGGFVDYVHSMVTILELALGNYRAALDSAKPVYDDDRMLFASSILPDLIEAAVRSNEHATAANALERLSARALASGTELALGLLARSRALLADDTDAEHHYTQAIDHLQRCRWAPQLARAHLLYGEWLRRERRRREARGELRAAHEMFDSIGAQAFAERARVERLATGEHTRQRTIESRDELTPQEAQVAHLASKGASNQEIAAQLFISPSTVAYHLRKVFRKLGVNNRTQLARAISERLERRAT